MQLQNLHRQNMVNVDIEDKNEKVAKRIWHDILQSSVRTLLWNVIFSTVSSIVDGTKFYVSGKLKGWIDIRLLPDNLYNIKISPNNDTPIIYNNVDQREVVGLIDKTITDYKHKAA